MNKTADHGTFFPQLEALRGLAALMIVLHHTPFVDGRQSSFIASAGLFVDFFFVLSGFVMVHAYGPRIAEGMSFAHYGILRLARLYPLHLVMLFLWLGYVLGKFMVAGTLGLEGELTGSGGLGSFVMNLLLLQSVGLTDRLTWNAPAWTVSAEFIVYLVFFAFVRVFYRVRLVASVGLSLSCYLVVLFVADRSSSGDLLVTYDYGVFRCAGGFFVGVALYQARSLLPVSASRWRASLLELAAIGLVLWTLASSRGDIGLQLACVAMFAALIHILSGSHGAVRSLLELAFLRHLGRISYSIYLIHALILTVVLNIAQYILKWDVVIQPGTMIKTIDTPYAMLINIALVLVIVALSHVTWRWIELPGQRLGRVLVPAHLSPTPSVNLRAR